MSVIQIKRIGWVDYAKVGAILGVVMLHTYFSAAFTMYFKAFVIPLFFFISGFLFSYDNNPDYSKFACCTISVDKCSGLFLLGIFSKELWQ